MNTRNLKSFIFVLVVVTSVVTLSFSAHAISIITIEPAAPTECPEVPTECPEILTFCPVVPTECPEVPTECPEIPTECPVNPTSCPSSITNCPVIPTACPPSLTQCPPIETECPSSITNCPVIPTACPSIPTACPPRLTRCPVSPTACPSIPTACPSILTECPVSPTACPVTETICPLIDSDGDGIPDCQDNCPEIPNGPDGGTCTLDSDNAGANCTGRAQCINSCTSPGDCSMDQEDTDEDGIGDVCDDYPYLTEPDLPTCPDGYYLIDNYEDKLRADIAPKSHTYSFHLYCDADLIVDGFAKEGHPENTNCTLLGGSDPQCTQYQDYENFEVDLDGTTFGNYTDYVGTPDLENAWFDAGPWATSASDGDHDLTFTHSEDGTTDVQSVSYKVRLCAQCIDCNDPDNDGVCDPDDNCPTIPNGPAKGSCFNYFTHEVWGECLDHGSCQDNSGEWYKWCDNAQNNMDGDEDGDACDNGFDTPNPD